MSDTKETESYTTVELTLDNDEIIECAILTVYEAAGKEYIALLPLEDETVLLYEYKEVGDEIELNVIEDDDEFDKVSNAFYDMYEDEE